jgi:hypothetical protein
MTGRRPDARVVRTAIALATLSKCLMCSGRPEVAGVFAPHDGPPLAVYALCGDCFANTTVEEREAALAERRRAA